MALTDRYENKIGTNSTAARDAYVRGLDLHLSANVGAVAEYERAIGEDPAFAAAYLGKAVSLYSSGKGRASREALARATDLSDPNTPYISGQIGVLGAAIGGQPVQAYKLAIGHLTDHPRDPLVADACIGVFSLIGFSGRNGREVENLQLAQKLAASFGDDWFFLAQLAFAEIEAGDIKTGGRTIEKAMGLNPRNAHGAHYKSHYHYECGEAAAGTRFLTDWMATYPKTGLMHGHNSWHLALWALAASDIDQMWLMVDDLIGPGGSSGPGINILTDTAALYHRAELAGVTVPQERWRALSAYATKIFPKPGLAFADIHAALAHAMAGNGDALALIVEGARGPAADMVTSLGTVFGAIARGDWHTAYRELSPVIAEHERIGGSRAQRDLVEFVYAHILLRLGQADKAAERLRTYRASTNYFGAVVGLHGAH